MTRIRLLTISFLASATIANIQIVQAGELPPVAAIQQALVGSWIIPANITDDHDKQFLASGRRALERFDADGTGEAWGYTDRSCTQVFTHHKWTWKVVNEVLVTTYPAGNVTNDKILSVGPNSFSFQPAGSPRNLQRVRALDCNTPAQ